MIDMDWLNQAFPRRGQSFKFDLQWMGPFVITSIMPDNVYRISTLRTGQNLVAFIGSTYVQHFFHLFNGSMKALQM